jgi:outer membrane lipoprotein carrier protein
MRKVLAVAIALFPVAARAQSADSILERAVTAYSRLNSIRAEFRQTLTNPLTGSSATTTGVILRRKPNLLSISFDNEDRIVADGASLWLYVPSSVPGQVIRSPARAAASSAFDPAGEILVSPRTRYTVSTAGSAMIGNRATHALSLTPKLESAPFSKVKLWVDDADANVRQFEVTDMNGLTRLIVITKLAANPSLSRRAFRFTLPKGVRVVDQPLAQPN